MLLALVLSACGPSPPTEVPRDASAPPPVAQTVQKEFILTATRAPSLDIRVPVGGYAEVRVEQLGVDVTLTLTSDGQTVRWDRVSGTAQAEQFAWIQGEAEATWALQLTPTLDKVADGKVKATIVVRRPEKRDALRARGFATLLAADDAKTPEIRQRKLELAHELFAASGDVVWQALTLDQLGRVDKHRGRRVAGLDKRRKALAIRRKANDRFGQVVSLIGIGNILSFQGKASQARPLYEEARYLSREIGDYEGEAIAIGNLGALAADSGQYTEALRLAHRSLELHRKVGDRRGEARSLAEVAGVLRYLGDDQVARTNLLEALAINRDIGSKKRQAEVLQQLAAMALQQRRPREALKLATQALAVRRSMAFASDREPFVLDLLGRIRRSLGDTKSARELHQKAIAGHRKNRSPAGEASAHWGLGLALADAGQRAPALVELKASAEGFRRLEAVREEARSQTALAQVALTAGGKDPKLLAMAEKAADRAVALVESVRATLGDEGLRGTYLGRTRDTYQVQMATRLARFALSGRSDDRDAAFAAAERGKARTMLERLGADIDLERARRRDPKLVEGLQEARADVRAAERQLRYALGQDDALAQKARREALVSAVETLGRARSALLAGRPAWTAMPRSPKLAEVQSALPEGYVLVEFVLGEERSWAWVVSPEAVRVEQLVGLYALQTLTEAALTSVTMRLRAGTSRPSVEAADTLTTRHLAALERAVLTPLKLAGKNLIVVPDGPLHAIPWSALAGLGEASVAVIPSAAVMLQVSGRKRAGNALASVAVLADPVFDGSDERAGAKGEVGALPRLRFSATEAKAVLAAFPDSAKRGEWSGFAARRETLLGGQLAGYDVLHLATHAIIDPLHPNLSGMALSHLDDLGQPIPGLLRLWEVYGMTLDARLVTLSACETSGGRWVDGEGVIGLTRGFVNAGADAVVASLWKVHDRATSALMSHFYRFLVQDRRGPAKALRKAQRELQKTTRWAAPYFWAGFTVTGLPWGQ